MSPTLRSRTGHRFGIAGFSLAVIVGLLLIGLAAAAPAQADNCMQAAYAAAGNTQTLGCTANDAGLAIVDVLSISDPCLCPATGPCTDTTNFTLQAAVQTPTASTRYDIGIYLARTGDAVNGTDCFDAVLNGSTPTAPTAAGVTATPTPAQLAGGSGPFRDSDGDVCGDALKTDQVFAIPPSATNNAAAVINLSVTGVQCTTTTGGLLLLPNGTTWKQTANNDCATVSDAVAGTSSKCTFANPSPTIHVPVPQVSATCSCDGVSVTPSGQVACTMTIINQANCIPDTTATPDVSEQCGTLAYYDFVLDDAAGGTYSNISTTATGDSATGTNSITWITHDDTGATSAYDYAIGPAENHDLNFVYNATATPGAVAINLTPRYYGQTPPPGTFVSQPIMATCNLNVDPNYATVTQMSATHSSLGGTMVTWNTDGEIGTLGYNLYRLNDQTGKYDKVNQQLLAASQNTAGGVYHFRDSAVGDTATYKVEEVRDNGKTMMFEPFRVSVQAATGDEIPGDYSATPHPISPRMALRLADSGSGRYAIALGGHKKTASSGSGSMAQIGTSQEGIYFLSANDIANAIGASSSKAQTDIKRGQLVLTNEGQQVAWQAASGNNGIYFYGAPYDDVYTDTNVYYLQEGTGTRMSTESGGGGAPVSGATFTDTAHFEQSPVGMARPDVATDPHQDYVFWGVVSNGSSTFNGSIDLSGVGAAGTATLKANLFGAASASYGASISVNGTSIGSVSWSGDGPTTQSLTFSQSLIHSGSNTVTVTQTNGTIFIDSFDITYARQYHAVNNALAFTGDGNATVSVSGFDSGQISVYNVSNPGAPKVVQGATIDQAPDSSWRVTIQPSSSSARYLAVSASGAHGDAAVSSFSPGNLKGSSGTSYVVIAPDSMANAAQALASYRNGKVVTLSQIYYDFNNGLSSPEAIKAFLAYAYNNWSPRPQYVALAAKGSYDYKDEEGVGGNLLPPLMAPSRNGLVAADNAFADVDGDNVPEMAVGRLPVLSSSELTAAINKIKGYDNGPGTGASVVFVADNTDSGGDYATTSDQLAGDIGSTSSSKIYLGQGYTTASARQAILNAINSGVQVFNYVGHGSFSQLAQEGLLTSSDVGTLTNGNRQPLLISATCIVADFALPGYSSLGENLVLYGNGGATAVFGPSWLSYNTDASKLNGELLKQLYGSGSQSIGQAVRKAMAAYAQAGGASDMLSVYNLLGDPATTLK